MADVTSTNDRTPIAIVIEEKDATITIVPIGEVQERLQDIAAAGIDMQLVSNWIAAGYSNSSSPVHHLVASDVADLWHIRTDKDVVDLLQSETERRKIVRKTYLNTRFSSFFSERSPLSNATYDRLRRLDEHPLDYIPMEPSHHLKNPGRYGVSNLPLTTKVYRDDLNHVSTVHERPHWYEDLTIPGLMEPYDQAVDEIGDAIFRNRSLQNFIDEIMTDGQALGDTMTKQADRIVEDGEALGDAMTQQAKELAEKAFWVIPKLPIDEHLKVPKSDVPVYTGGSEPPQVIGEETEVELPSVDK